MRLVGDMRFGWVSEVLNGKRNLTLPMIKRLHEGLKIRYENLIR